MPAIKPTCVRDLKLRINLADVVGRVATLRRAGSRFKGLCPFHSEKTPSFHVDADKGFYKCFGCGKAGDIISFVRETEQLSFTEAVETLGQRFGIPIEYEEGSGPTREERTLRQELFDLHEAAADHFHQVFRGASQAGSYMRNYWVEKRRFEPALAEEFKIGAAEPAENSLGALVLKRKFSEEAIRQSGLFFVRDGAFLGLSSLRPRFRGRLMIPIRDHQGRIVAFTARQTDLTPEDDPAREAKYVNSPETPIFIKGGLLFNLDRAREPAGKENKPFLLVEGQLDALRCWSVGLKTAVAPQGTSITDGQLQLLRRYQTRVDCFFDSDSAGQKAALRFLPMALKAGLEVRFLTLRGQEKLDPDLLFLEHGAAAYTRLQEQARSGMAFAAAALLPDSSRTSPEQKARAAAEINAIILQSDSEVARSQFLIEAARELHLPPDAIARDFQKLAARGLPPSARPAAPSSAPAPGPTPRSSNSPEHHLLLVCLHFEGMGDLISARLPHDWIDTSHVAGRLLNRFLAEFEQHAWPGKEALDPLLETEEERALVASLLFENPQFENPSKIASEGLTQLRARVLGTQLRQIELALANIGADSNTDAISLLKQRNDLQRQLREPIVLHGVG